MRQARRQPPDPAPAATPLVAGWEWLLAVALTSAVLLAYQPAWHGGLLWDDAGHVTRPDLRSWQGLSRIWFEWGATQQYYPLVHSVFWVEHKLWGDATLGYHLVNLLLHAAAAVLVALVLRRLRVPGAYLAAAIFALHPLHVETVAWITELKNTLSAVFYLGAMLVYLRFDQTRKISFYGWALGCFLLALLSKTVTATLPGALLVIFWWQRGRLSWRKDLLPLVPFFVLGMLAGVFTAWVERKLIGAEGAAFEFTLVERCLIAGRAICFYLGKLFWPANLTFIYPRWQVSQAIGWQYLFPAAVLLLVAALWGLRRRWRAPLAGLLFFIGTLFPALGFCNVFPFRYSFVADHFQYLASLGVITLFSAAVTLLLQRWGLRQRPVGYALCLGLLVVLGAMTWRQSRMYDDLDTLYRVTLKNNPDCWLVHNNLGVLLVGQGHLDEAIAEYHKALEIKPDYADVYNNLGSVWANRGKADKAMDYYRRAVDCYGRVAETNPGRAVAHCNLGNLFEQKKKFDQSVVHFQQALALVPNYIDAQSGLAWLLATCPVAALRNGAEAVKHAEQVNRYYRGTRPDLLKTLAAAYAEAGRFPEALAAAQTGLALAVQQHSLTVADELRAQIALYQAGKPYHQTPSSSPANRGTQ
jgi:tetratricopeptide (TPR) repeat protein